MPEPYLILFTVGALVLVSILASRISDRVGLPALITFLGIGMLAGSDGPGGIQFADPSVANMIGTIALAFILFSGGLDTNWQIIRPVLVRGVLLSTIGVAITAGLVGVFAWGVLGFSLLTALLIGAIISSTDAAAVFSILRGRGVGLKGNLKPLLELESGSNDPMAIFLTLGLTQLIVQPDFALQALLPAFVINMVGGAVVGLGAGWVAAAVFNRLRLDFEGLYPVVSLCMVLLTFGAAELIQANGFLAVYVCGVMLNATDFNHKRAVSKFHDGIAWLMQIGMFLVLGLLVFPSELPGVALNALLVAFFLMFVARPVAVAAGLWRSNFDMRERAFVAWTGLRGAVPIVLATFPMMAGYENSAAVFNIVFFTVLTSVLVQGTLLMPVARWLGVDNPLVSGPRFSLAIERQGVVHGETRELEILPNMAAVGTTVADLNIPRDVLILLIHREERFVVPRGDTRIAPYDTLTLLGRPDDLRTAVEQINRPSPRVLITDVESDPLEALPWSTDQRFLSKQVVVVGYGRVGRRIADTLAARGVPVVIADEKRAIVEELRHQGKAAVLGDASSPIVLAQAHVARAAVLIIATPDTMKVRQMAEVARKLNPGIDIVIRSHSEVEAALLEKEHAGTIFVGEHELAKSILRHVVREFTKKQDEPAK